MKNIFAAAACLIAASIATPSEAGFTVVDGVTFWIPDDANIVVPMKGSFEIGQDKRLDLPFKFANELEVQGLVNDIRRNPGRQANRGWLFMTGIKGDPAYSPMYVWSDANDPIRLDREGDRYDVGMTRRKWAGYRALPDESGVSTIPAGMYPRSLPEGGSFKDAYFVRTGLDFAPEARIVCREGNTLCEIHAPLVNGWSINFSYVPVDGADKAGMRERVRQAIGDAMPRGTDGFTQWTATSLNAKRKPVW